jgi:hypothetical protein
VLRPEFNADRRDSADAGSARLSRGHQSGRHGVRRSGAASLKPYHNTDRPRRATLGANYGNRRIGRHHSPRMNRRRLPSTTVETTNERSVIAGREERFRHGREVRDPGAPVAGAHGAGRPACDSEPAQRATGRAADSSVAGGVERGPERHRGTVTTDQPTTAVETTAPPSTGSVSWRDAAVGAAFEAEEAVAGLLATAGRVAVSPARRSADLATNLMALARRRIVELTERGAAEQARARHRAARAAHALATTAAASPVVDRVVDVQVERILRPLVVAVLDDVLVLLDEEPERITSLIRGQRDSMADELVGRIRTGASAGDTVVDRWTARVFRRTPAPVPVPGPDAHP